MNVNFFDETEQPLDHLLEGSGFCNIFRTIGVIGDSLSSGEAEYTLEPGITGYVDMFEYSWGQFMARTIGCTVHNFSKGGMTAEEFCNGFGELCGAFGSAAKPCQCYIIALGVNDRNRSLKDCRVPLELGDVSDIGPGGGFYNKKTIIGYYGRIIQKIKAVQPDAKIFLMTIPRDSTEETIRDPFTEQIYKLTERFRNTYVLDFRTYAPIYDAKFREKFFMGGHMNAAGYSLTARMVISYMDYIIRSRFEEFKQVALIGTPYHTHE